MPISSIVDGDALVSVLWVSTLAGVAVPGAFGLAILGMVRATEAQRAGHGAGATFFGLLALVALAVVLASVVVGIIWMSSG